MQKRVVHKKRLLALDGGMRGMAGKKDLAPDSFDKYACAICFKPRSPLLPGGEDEITEPSILSGPLEPPTFRSTPSFLFP